MKTIDDEQEFANVYDEFKRHEHARWRELK